MKSPNIIVMALALLFVGAGSAVAGSKIKGSQIAARAITSTHIKDGQVAPKDLNRGITAAIGSIYNVQHVESVHISLEPGQTSVDAVGAGGFTADCPSGYDVIGTGFSGSIAKTTSVRAYTSFVGGFVINDSSIRLDDIYLMAICAQTFGNAETAKATATAASARSSKSTRSKDRAQYLKDQKQSMRALAADAR